ncbi:MAG TPA: alkaline phosphatase family protein [Allosphingosinicella sp.]|nr:alkaline phosphatase family protein [Allosphingosinicella sp.]
MELFYGTQLVQTAPGGSNVFYQLHNSSSILSVRISRAVDPNLNDRRRYQIRAEYMSVLPLEERRIPLAFLQAGFDQNWNDGYQYLEMLRIENKLVQWRWDPKLSSLYPFLSREDQTYTGIEELDFPAIVLKDNRLSIGWEADPIIPPGTWSYKIPYISLKLDMECLDSREVDADGPDDLTLPKNFYFDIRFFLRTLGGRMMYEPRILTDLDVGEDHVMWVDVDLPERLKKVERTLFAKQWNLSETGFDAIIRPWFVGHFELDLIEVDEARGDIIMWHVGRPIKQEMVTAAEPSNTPIFQGLVPLFADAKDEKWAPQDFGGPPVRLPPRVDPGNLSKVDHIIILMQENRSFDQVFGYLSRDGHPELGLQPEVEGLLPDPNQRDVNTYQFEPVSDPTEFRSRKIDDTSWPFSLENPCHSRDCVNLQISGGMKGFVPNFAARLGNHATRADLQRIMDYYDGEALPIYAKLAKHFAICDHWFGSHIGGTLPNRHITVSGELNRDRHNQPEEENSHMRGFSPSERKTMFDHLTARNVSWRVFEHGYSFIRFYRNFTFDMDRVAGFEDPLRGFEALADQDQLPAVSFIEPDYIEAPDGNDDHAPADMYNGQRLVARIVRALIRNGQWNKSLLLITYDEHGGFYDHVYPPDAIETPEGSRPIPPLGNGVSRLGPRVPAIVVSPLIPKQDGKVFASKTVFEHASIPATVLRRFCGPRPPLSGRRVSAAADLREFLTLDTPRPASDFADLLQLCDQYADGPNRSSPGVTASNVPTRKLPPDADPDKVKEDFQGFIALASATTGRRAT